MHYVTSTVILVRTLKHISPAKCVITITYYTTHAGPCAIERQHDMCLLSVGELPGPWLRDTEYVCVVTLTIENREAASYTAGVTAISCFSGELCFDGR